MSLSNPKTITEVFAAHNIQSGAVCVLLECQELALAVTLQGKYEAGLDTSRYGIHCSTRLAGTLATHESFHMTRTGLDLADIHLIREHLNELLADSANNVSPEQ